MRALITPLTVLILTAALWAQPAPRAPSGSLAPTLAYIHASWRTLLRTPKNLLAAALDPKFPPPSPRARVPIYVPRTEPLAPLRARLRSAMAATDYDRIDLLPLPESTAGIRHGLLYVPHPYVVPGGRFNEMYGWDSFFIVLGLLRDGDVELARWMTENQLYQVEHYGKVLNANRTYYLSRSHPPFLAWMVRRVYERTRDRAWLARAYPLIERQYAFFTRSPRHVESTGLARYDDEGSGPAPEVVSGEVDAQGLTHYDRVRAYFKTHTVPDYDVTRFYDRASDRLTELYYRADRAMRESGFDPSNRFGPFNAGILDHNPVCLNSLLYAMELDAATIAGELGRPVDATRWRLRAALRRKRVNELMWDETDGLYYDYDHVTRARRRYAFATTFFPLWVGLATPRHAARVRRSLALFERPGGLSTSNNASGNQWDEPFGWAPLQHVAVQGLRRYGYAEDADRLTVAFLSVVHKEFVEHGSIFEKYDVVRRESSVAGGLKFGYTSNEIGFGWTNAAFIDLLAELPAEQHERIARGAR